TAGTMVLQSFPLMNDSLFFLPFPWAGESPRNLGGIFLKVSYPISKSGGPMAHWGMATLVLTDSRNYIPYLHSIQGYWEVPVHPIPVCPQFCRPGLPGKHP